MEALQGECDPVQHVPFRTHRSLSGLRQYCPHRHIKENQNIFFFFFFSPTCSTTSAVGTTASQHRGLAMMQHIARRTEVCCNTIFSWNPNPLTPKNTISLSCVTWVFLKNTPSDSNLSPWRSQLLSVYHVMFPLCNGARIDPHSCWRRGVLMCSRCWRASRPRLGNNCWEFIGGLEL